MSNLFGPGLRASRMTVNVAHVVLQMSTKPIIFGCAEVVAKSPSSRSTTTAFRNTR